MVDEVLGESPAELPVVPSEKLLSRRFLHSTILENIEDVAELIRPILRKSAGMKAMTVEEKLLCEYFIEMAIGDADADI